MHSVQNVILVVPQQNETNPPWNAKKIRQLCDFRTGLGADQVMVCEPNDGLTIWNADGSQAAACGNGTRCVIGIMPTEIGEKRVLYGPSGPLICWKTDGHTAAIAQGAVTVGAIQRNGCLVFSAVSILDAPLLHVTPAHGAVLGAKNDFASISGIPVYVGNDHLVVFGPPPEGLDPLWRPQSKDFPDGVNVSFVWQNPETPQQSKTKSFDVKTWERGIGLSFGCGSAACAIGAALDFCPSPNSSDRFSNTSAAEVPLSDPPMHLPSCDRIYALHMPGGIIHVWPDLNGWVHSAPYHILADCWWIDTPPEL